MSVPTLQEAERIKAERDHAGMMKYPVLWPLYPFLALRKGDLRDIRTLVTGFMHNGEDLTIIYGNVILAAGSEDYFKNCKREKFDSIQAILDAGWVVD